MAEHLPIEDVTVEINIPADMVPSDLIQTLMSAPGSFPYVYLRVKRARFGEPVTLETGDYGGPFRFKATLHATDIEIVQHDHDG